MFNSSENILVIKHGALGDLIQSDGVLRDIRQHFSDADITLLTSPAYADLMQRCPHIDHILIDPRAPWWQWFQQRQLMKQLKQAGFSCIIDLQNSDRTRLYHHALFAEKHWIGRLQEAKPESGLQGQMDLLKQAGISIQSSLQPNVSWLADDVSHLLSDELQQQGYVALIHGCSAAHPEKRWPHYPQLADALIAHGFEVINIIGPDELELADDLPGFTPVLSHGLLSWSELAGLLQHASFVIGNDTGPSHLASCLGSPGLALFGSHTSVDRAAIRRGQFQALKVNQLDQLSVESVLAAVLPKLPTPNLRLTRPVLQPSYSAG